MADLQKTGQKMQELVAFWRNCGVITGIRTPSSPQWPDPKVKLRGKRRPDYLWQRINAVHAKVGRGDEGLQGVRIELARWKEALLNTDLDPIISEVPLAQPLLQKLELVWQGYESFRDNEYVEDAMIDVLGRWRRGEEDESCSETSSPPELDVDTNLSSPKTSSSPRLDLDTYTPRSEAFCSPKLDSPRLDFDMTLPCSDVSRSDATAMKNRLRFLKAQPRNTFKLSMFATNG